MQGQEGGLLGGGTCGRGTRCVVGTEGGGPGRLRATTCRGQGDRGRAGGGVRGRLHFVWVSGASHGPGTSVGDARPPWHGGRPDRGGTATASLELREDGETGRPAGAQPALARPRSPFLQPRAGDTRFPPSPAPRLPCSPRTHAPALAEAPAGRVGEAATLQLGTSVSPSEADVALVTSSSQSYCERRGERSRENGPGD